MTDDNTQEDNTEQQEAPPVWVHVGDQSGENRQGGDEIDIIDLGGGSDSAGGGQNFNIILGGSDADYLRSEGFWDDVFGGSGDDLIVATGYGGWLFGGSGDDTIIGSDADASWAQEVIFGGSGDDTIDGRGGDDFIIGGAGDDTLTGGSGADTFFFWEGHGSDTITDFNSAEGDRIHLTNFGETISWDVLSTKLSTVTDENGAVTGVKIDLSDWGGGEITLEGITSVSDVTEDMFVLDRIAGGDSDDTLQGGASDDILTGGAGADTFVFDEASGEDTIADFNAAEGDRIDLSSFSRAITWDALSTKISTVTDENGAVTGVRIDLGDWGGGAIVLDGMTSVDDVTADMFILHPIVGSDDVDDTLEGGSGDDTMTGGSGADTFVFVEGHGNDTITDFSAADGDRIDLSGFDGQISWEALRAAMTQVADDAGTTDVDETATVIDLSAWGGGTITLQGVTAADLTEDMFDLPGGAVVWHYGSEGDDTIAGGRSHDLMYGMEGDDTLRGGEGDDWMFGGEGDDTLEGGAGHDLLIGGEGDDTLDGGEGDDMLIGGEGDDTLTGGGGADTFVFGEDSGNDTITDFDTARDTIDLTTFSASITWQQLQEAISAGGDDPDAPGTVIDLSGFGGGTIVLDGVAPGDLTAEMFVLDDFAGTEGDDTIEGGTTDDTLTGGGGADTFVFDQDSGHDTITDFASGTDKIDLSAFTGITSIADLAGWQAGGDAVIFLGFNGGGTITLEGVSLIDLEASDFILYQDTHTGTAEADTLTGGAGDDTIDGLGGDDMLTGGDGDDTFVFAAGHGDDTITDFADGEDTIDLSAFNGINGLGDLSATQVGSDVRIDLSEYGGGTITLQDFTLGDLDETDFVFHEDGQQDGM